MAKDTYQVPSLVDTLFGGVDESVDVIDTKEKFTRADGTFPYFVGSHQRLFGKKLIDAYPGKSVFAIHQTFNGICQYGYYLQTREKLYYHLCVSPSDHRLNFATLQSFGVNLQNVTLDSLGQVGPGVGQLSKDTSHSCVFDFPDRPTRPIPPDPGTIDPGFPWPPIDDIEPTEPEPPVDPDLPPGAILLHEYNGPFNSLLIEVNYENPQMYAYPEPPSPLWHGRQHFFGGIVLNVDPRQVTERDSNFGDYPFARSIPHNTGVFGNPASYLDEYCVYHPDNYQYQRRANWFVRLHQIQTDLAVGLVTGILYGFGEFEPEYNGPDGPPGPFAANVKLTAYLGAEYTKVIEYTPPAGPSPPLGAYYQEQYYAPVGGAVQNISPIYNLNLHYTDPAESTNWEIKGVQLIGFWADLVSQKLKFYSLPFNEDWDENWSIP